MNIRTTVLTLLLVTVAHADDLSRIEHSLRQSYEKQTRALQNFYSESHLKYHASGALIGIGQPGPWTLGYIAIDSLRLTHSRLELRGKRVAAQLQTETNHVSYVRVNQDLHIDIAASPTPDEATLRSAIERVFYAPKTNFALVVPDYWRDAVTGNVVRAAGPDERPR